LTYLLCLPVSVNGSCTKITPMMMLKNIEITVYKHSNEPLGEHSQVKSRVLHDVTGFDRLHFLLGDAVFKTKKVLIFNMTA
jgi:hypothetical protein